MTATTINDLVAEYVRRADAIISLGGEPPVPDLMQAVLAAHPEIAIDIESFARMCAAAMRHAAEAVVDDEALMDRTFEWDDSMPPPRTLTERLRLAIRWCRDYHAKEDDPGDELAGEMIRHLDHLGLKLVWKDGAAITPAQLSRKEGDR
jgi:hypothetical protein